MIYKVMKAMVCTFDGDIEFFHIIAGVLRGDTFGPYMFIIFRITNVNRPDKRKWLKKNK